MVKRKDMKNMVERNGWYHFRGYVPKDLIAAGHQSEIPKSLNTRDHSIAIERREEYRIIHNKWIAEKRARRDGQYLVLQDLSDEQALGLARDAYALLMPTIEEYKTEQANRTDEERNTAIQVQNSVLATLEAGAVEGSEIFGSFEYYTNRVLERRMIRINDSIAYNRLVARIGDAAIQIKREQIAAMSGRSGSEVNPLFTDIESGGPKASIGVPDGRPNAYPSGTLSIQSQVKPYIDYISHRQQKKNVQGSEAALNIFMQVLGHRRDANSITRDDFEKFKSLIVQLPPNAKKKYPNTSYLKIAEIRKDSDGHLKPESINGYLSRIIAFRNWLVETEVVASMPELRKYKVPDHENTKKKRDIINQSQMVSLAQTKKFVEWASDNSVMFWAFVIGFYQGIRQGEIAGLLHSDYVVREGVHCLSLHPDIEFIRGAKAGKPKTIVREVPIHQVLVDLGFPKLFSPSRGTQHVFSEVAIALKKNPERARGDVISRKTNRFLKNLGFADDGYNIVFHSTRHTFEDACKRCNLVDGADNILGGWSGDTTKDIHYGSSRFELWMKSEIDKITYGKFDKILRSLNPM